jgi:hypothetical protein
LAHGKAVCVPWSLALSHELCLTPSWRLKPDSIMLALGGERVTCGLQVKGIRPRLSGGDLQKPVSLTRVGPPGVRPDSVPVPTDPDKVEDSGLEGGGRALRSGKPKGDRAARRLSDG